MASTFFPSREDVLRLIRSSPTPLGKREIARAFRVSGSADRERLRRLIHELEADGSVERGAHKRVAPPKTLPEISVVEVVGFDGAGQALLRPLSWSGDDDPPRIFLPPGAFRAPPVVGDRFLVQLDRLNERLYEGRLIRRVEDAEGRIIGVFRLAEEGGRIVPTDRRANGTFLVVPANRNGAEPEELVLAEVLPVGRAGRPQARVVERLGAMTAPSAVSVIAIHAHGLPSVFGAEAIREAATARPVDASGRTDLRHLPLVTVDGADARDFDDAVFAEPDPETRGGWHLIVAIADVAWYVRPGSALDRAAFARGNSVYFPDKVVPMLPEALSNGLCSLKPGEDRAVLAFHLWIDRHGELTRYRLVRGVMRSAARLTYEQLQAAADGAPDVTMAAMTDKVTTPLFGAFRVLWAARLKRGTLDLDLPERQVRFGDDGSVAGIGPRQRLDSHRLIEEFMIAANVAAARALEDQAVPCLYRVHDRPSAAKLEALRGTLRAFGHALGVASAVAPGDFTRILASAAGKPESGLISEVVLRAQAQAAYAPVNIGHFGLALARYAHFTSPIRRYADLVVHRALIAAYGLGGGGLDDDERARFAEIGDHLSSTERRAAAAERDALDRFTAIWLTHHVGETFPGRVAGLNRFGLFIRLTASGADGFVPVDHLPADRYVHDEVTNALVGQKQGLTFTLGDPLEVRVADADPVTGSVRFVIGA